MTTETFLALTAALEPWVALAVVAAVVLIGADALLAERPDRPGPSLDAPIAARTERWAIAGIVALALALRLVGWRSALTPAWWFSEIAVLPIDKMLRDGVLWETWKGQLATMKIDVAYQATAVLPVLAGVQALLGPRFGLGVVAGAIMGTTGVVLAWALGRRMRSQAFGLVLAALVAFSPLPVMWSRMSTMCTEAVVHVLLAMLVGYVAGRRGSVLLACLAGIVAWTSFQQYYAARASVPVALVAILAGADRSMRLGRGVVLVLIAVLAFGAVHRAVHGQAFGQSYWPSYREYVGNKGERTLLELIERNREPVVHEARTTLAHYFVKRRTGWDSDAHGPGLRNGGLTSPAMGVLGVVGLLAVCRRWRRQWPWLVVGAVGLALPSFSAASARRMLVFDLAWMAFAAHGLLAVVDGIGRRFSRRARALATVGVLAALAVWSVAAVFVLSAATAPRFGAHIPFGDAGFGDGITCKRCLEAARGWEREIADGALVVLFDNDVTRENRTSPGGLPAYGKIAALANGAPHRFTEIYALMSNFDFDPPTVGAIFDATRATFADELAARIEETTPRRIVWHFERPTRWEQWLARRLVAAGGTLETFPTALSRGLGIRVITPAERRDDALAIIDDLAFGLDPDARACFTLADSTGTPLVEPVFLLATGDSGLDAPPQWLLASWSKHRYGNQIFTTPTSPIGARIGPLAGGSQRIDLFVRNGNLTAVDVPSLRMQDLPWLGRGAAFGRNCAAMSGLHWWLVDPGTGQVASTSPAAKAMPPGAWIGIASAPDGRLVLASAEQEVLVLDAARGAVVTRFPARVSPSIRDSVDECTPIAVGADWIGLPNLRTTVLSMYSWTGRDLGTVRLDRRVRANVSLSTIGGAGHYLAVPSDVAVRNFEVTVDPSCDPRTAAGH